jgi:PucR family transcriptional regulator, purine catabolism regulatory protein
MLTVQELQQHILPEGTELVAGQGGLGHEISWVLAGRSRPPIFDGLKGNELVLISVRVLRVLDEEFQLSHLFSYLSEKGVAGAAVLGEITEAGIETANELNFPLFALPEGTSLPELERNITRYIAENNQQLQHWNQEVYRQFTELAIEGKGISAVAELLCKLSGKAVVVEDANFRTRAKFTPEHDPLAILAGVNDRRNGLSNPANPEINPVPVDSNSFNSVLHSNLAVLREWLHNKDLRASDPPLHLFEMTPTEHNPMYQLTAPIIAQSTVAGYVSLLGSDFDRRQRVALSRAASALAIERARELAVSAVEDKFQANVLDELLDGGFASPESIIERAKRLGYNLQLPYWVASFAFRQQEKTQRKKPLTIVLDGRELELDLPVSETMGRELQRLVEQESSRRNWATITRVRDDRFVVLFANANGKEFAGPVEAKKAVVIFQERFVASYPDISISAGLGRYDDRGVEGLPRQSAEAEKAVMMGLRLFGPGQLTFFGDLGVYRLLLTIGNTRELRDFYQEVLGRLMEHDSRNGGELMRTLEAYFRYQGSPSEMARKIDVHRNTLLYRLRRIQDITGFDLEDSETALALHLALRIQEVLGEKK